MITEIPAVILAGGLGTRLGKISEDIPKALATISGKPFLDWKIEQLEDQGVSCIYLLAGHKGEQIYDHVAKSNYSIPVCLISDGVSQLGTAGALIRAIPAIAGEFFLLTYGDNLLELPIGNFWGTAKRLDSSLMVVTSSIGEADIANSSVEGDFISRYSKDGGAGMQFIDYGYSVIRKRDILGTTFQRESDLAQIFSRLSNEKKLAAHITNLGYAEIGTPKTLESTEAWLKSRQLRGQLDR